MADEPKATTADGEWEPPATLVNFSQITFGPMGVRIALGESSDMTPENVRWRVAVLVPTVVFPSFVQLMDQILAQVQKSQRDPDTKDN